MLRLKRIGTTAALAICLVVPATSVGTAQATTGAPVDLRMPDTRDAAREAAASQVDLRSPDARDAARTTAPAPVAVIERPVADGFQWGDAGIGAAGTLALVLLVSCLGMVAGQRRRTGRATAPSH